MLNCIDIINKRKELWQRFQSIDKDQNYRDALAQKLIEKESKPLREEIQRHPEYMVEMFFVIVNKDQEIVPFFLNNVQQIFLDRLNSDIELYKRGEKTALKYLILKGRQQGFTSFITAYQLACTITRRNFSGFTIADSSDNTATIFEDKAKFPYSLLPDVIKPSEKYNTRREMLFERLNSKWRIATAGNREVGRSKTINFFHASEAAFWKSIQSITAALGQALTRDSITILESTANGFNEYKTLWDEGIRGENNYTPLFFEWWLTPEYTLNFPNKETEKEFKERIMNPKGDFDETLLYLYKEKGLNLNQLYWYDAKRKDLKELLPQEYPLNADQSFLNSGSPVMDNEIVIKRIDALMDYYKEHPPIKGRFHYEFIGEQINDRTIKFIPDKNGDVMIYQDVQPFTPYVIGADTSESFSKNRDSDYCVGQVLNNTNGLQAAIIRGRYDTDIFAKNLYCLGKYYNNALIGIETNFDLHPVKELSRLHYPRQYVRENADVIGTQMQVKYGFHTSSTNRNMIISNLVEIVREHINLISDITTLREMLTFVDIDGKPQASVGEHDDTILALCIAYAIRKQQDYNMQTQEREKTIYDILPPALIENDDYYQEEDSIW